jgi:hypothetical protein
MYEKCECVLDIIGPQDVADTLRRLVTTAESDFDFNAIVPTPRELWEGTPSDVANEAWLLKYGNWEYSRRFCPPKYATRRDAIAAARRAQPWRTLDELADAVEHRIRKYGQPDRLLWAKENWGVELPACCVEWIAPAGTEGRGSCHTVFFDTDSTVPVSVMVALSRRFPDLTLRLSYSEPHNETRGFMTFMAGRVEAKRAEWFDFREEWQIFVSHDLSHLSEGIYIGDARPAADGIPAMPRSKWANPFLDNCRTPAEAEDLYWRWLQGDAEAAALVPPGDWHRPVAGEICDELRGMLLVCDCPWGECKERRCHGYALAIIGRFPIDEDDDSEAGPEHEFEVVQPESGPQ